MKTRSTTTKSIRRRTLATGMLTATVWLGLMAGTAQAAVVTWGAVQNITGDSDVLTTGTLVAAENYGLTGVSSTTVNGVTFSARPFGAFASNSLGAVTGPFSSLSAPYQTLLSSAVLGLATTGLNTSLTIGQTYQVQLWSNISNVAANSVTDVISGNTVSLNSNTTAAIGGLGQYVVGTFVADTVFQTFSFAPTGRINGFQIRALPSAVPEPGSALAGMLALGVCLSGLAGRSRRQPAAVTA